MKKVILGLAFSAYVAVGFMACSKTGCYKCSFASVYEVSICDNNVTGVGLLNESAATSIKAGTASGSQTNDGYKATAENQGYTCTAQ